MQNDKASSIVNDAYDWAIEAMSNAPYPQDCSSASSPRAWKTHKTVNSLSALDIWRDG